MQQLALIGALKQESKDQSDRDWTTFKYMAIAMHPERASQILEALDGNPEESGERPLTDEERNTYVPWGEDAKDLLRDLQFPGLGFRIEED